MAKLLVRATDADHDPVTLVSVGNPSAHGATVAINGPWVTYAPPDGLADIDTFTYTVTDGFTTTTATITVLVAPPDNAPTKNILSIQVVPNPSSHLLIRFLGVPGRTYQIQAATTLDNPVWTPLDTEVADETGLYQYEDWEVDLYPTRFYRAVTP